MSDDKSEPLEQYLTASGAQIEQEFELATPELRFLVRPSGPRKLQQKWIIQRGICGTGDGARYEWRDIPEVD